MSHFTVKRGMLSAWNRVDSDGTMIKLNLVTEMCKCKGGGYSWDSIYLNGVLFSVVIMGLYNKPSRPLEVSRNKSFVQKFISGYQKSIYCHLMQFPKKLIKAVFTFTFFTPEFASPCALNGQILAYHLELSSCLKTVSS